MIVQPFKPDFRLLVKGIDVTNELLPQLISLTYTDHDHGKADELSAEMHDRDGLWRGAWCPEHGDKAQLSIMGVDAGSFEIDEPNAKIGRGGDTFNFSGVSAPISRSLRSPEKIILVPGITPRGFWMYSANFASSQTMPDSLLAAEKL